MFVCSTMDIQISAVSELMLNQQHAHILSPQKQFEVLQTSSGESLFFSIGEDDVFYVAREAQGSSSGWRHVDLSSSLGDGAPVKAKSFDLSQNPETLDFDVVLSLGMGEQDMLYVSVGNNATSEEWEDGASWTQLHFDADTDHLASTLQISDVFLMDLPDRFGDTIQNCFVFVLRDPGNPTGLVDRFYIDFENSPHWKPHTLAIEFEQGSVQVALGQDSNRGLPSRFPGMYTYGTLADGSIDQLMYSPQRGFSTITPPAVSRLNAPADTGAIASAQDDIRCTNLFVAAPDGLYLFTSDNLSDDADPIQVLNSPEIAGLNLFDGVSQLVAHSVGDNTIVWAINGRGDIFYMECATSDVTNPDSWLLSPPLATGIEQLAFFANKDALTTTLFVQQDGQTLLQLTQNPVTSVWHSRPISLPTLDPDVMLEFHTATTQVSLSAGDGSEIPADLACLFSAEAPAPVYINNEYYIINPSFPIQVSPDSTGSFTILQRVDAIEDAQDFTISVGDLQVVIDPTARAFEKLATIETGDDLGAITIQTGSFGQDTKPLLPSDVSESDKNAVASMINSLVQVKNDIAAEKSGVVARSPLPSPFAFGITFDGPDGKGATFVSHQDAAIEISKRSDLVLGSRSFGGKPSKIGDVFEAIGDFFEESWSIFVEFVDDQWELIVEVAGQVFRAIVETVQAVAGVIQRVFEEIGAFFEDLIAWLGFLFNFESIIRTQRVQKNIIKAYGREISGTIREAGEEFADVVANWEDKIDEWAGLPDLTEGESTGAMKIGGKASSRDPQSSWAHYHTVNGASAAQSESDLSVGLGTVESLVDELAEFVEDTVDNMAEAMEELRSVVLPELHSLSPFGAVKAILGVVGKLAVSIMADVVELLVEIVASLIDGIIDLLDATIKIPVITPIYKFVTGNDLSILDLMCLVSAVPANVIYKATINQEPFPSSDSTNQLINSPNLSAIKALCVEPNYEKTSVGQAVDQVLYMGSVSGALVLAAMKPLNLSPTPIASKIKASANFVYMGGTISGVIMSEPSPEKSANDLLGGLGVGKALASDFSPLAFNEVWKSGVNPVLDLVLAIGGLVPPTLMFVENDSPKQSDKVKMAGTATGKCSSALGFFKLGRLNLSPPVALAVTASDAFLTATTGYLSVGAGVLMAQGK